MFLNHGYKQEMTMGSALYLSASPARRRISTRSLRGTNHSFGMRTLMTVGLVWALCLSLTSCNRDLDSDLVETETGWQFGDDDGDIETFDAPAGAPAGNGTAPAPAVKPKGGVIPLINGDFELTTLTATATAGQPFLVDNTTSNIVNWVAGGNGVQVMPSAMYGKPAYSKAASVFCIHLNNPKLLNVTQGSLSTTLAASPASGKSYTVQYDVCKCADGPLNLVPAVRVSAMQGSTVHDWVIHYMEYNASDTLGHSTWTRQSLVYVGTGAATTIKFESMSERWGPMIDNVEILTGSHPLAGAPFGKMTGMCQKILPLVTVVALASFHIL
ncbi:hypothetical protein M758_6G208100 [Ceratodon purpureus]|uniref:DUF642 domain-containing protein n=1 Tax=Ceratodon purpureus TaxID=3225 RepID=A0A8T0HK47_CERPU|nr:hypothetical protein KC19_6G217300 [Ceratodon purpureus]KAG0614843.1 hypothetical protein M758_6G208100 [Ceratodon purpureus]